MCLLFLVLARTFFFTSQPLSLAEKVAINEKKATGSKARTANSLPHPCFILKRSFFLDLYINTYWKFKQTNISNSFDSNKSCPAMKIVRVILQEILYQLNWKLSRFDLQNSKQMGFFFEILHEFKIKSISPRYFEWKIRAGFWCQNYGSFDGASNNYELNFLYLIYKIFYYKIVFRLPFGPPIFLVIIGSFSPNTRVFEIFCQIKDLFGRNGDVQNMSYWDRKDIILSLDILVRKIIYFPFQYTTIKTF